MSNYDMQLIAAIVQHQDLETVYQHRINTDTFRTTEGKLLFDFIDTWYTNKKNYGTVPTKQTIKNYFPIIELQPTEQSVSEACTILLEAQASSILEDGCTKALQSDSLTEANNVLLRTIEGLSKHNQQTPISNFGLDALGIVLRDLEAGNECTIGYPWPEEWVPLAKGTNGIERSMYIVFHARPANMKSWVLIYLATHLAMNVGLRTCLFNCELSNESVIRRMAMCHSKLNYQRYRRKAFTEQEEQHLMLSLGEIRQRTQQGKHDGNLLIIDKSWERTPQALRTYLTNYKAQVCLIDGAHLLEDAKGRTAVDHKIATNISRALQRTTGDLNIPIIAVTQTNRDSENKTAKQRKHIVSGVGYTDSFGQDADVVIELALGTTELTWLVQKVREDEKILPFTTGAIPAEDFAYKGDFISEELEDEANPKKGDKTTNKNNTSLSLPDFGALHRNDTIAKGRS